ncbi:MAG: LytTR family DNA-binding domain-containing protein [Acidobacteriota bacterium]
MIRTLIADDEAPARRKIRSLLAKEPDFEVVGEAEDGVAAVGLIRSTAIDLVLLDIQMPGLDGFDVIEEVGVESMPLVVFITAYDEHALRAFEVHAMDYITKPFSPSRFKGTLDRIRGLLGRGNRSDLVERIERLMAAMRPAPRHIGRILVERGPEREVLLLADHVDLIRADKNHVRFFTRDGEYLRRCGLADIANRLDPDRFLQINRSEIVRLDAVKEFQPWFHGDYRVVMKDGTILSWSRRFRARSKELFD